MLGANVWCKCLVQMLGANAWCKCLVQMLGAIAEAQGCSPAWSVLATSHTKLSEHAQRKRLRSLHIPPASGLMKCISWTQQAGQLI
jgi:hypothetical protein